MNNLTTKATEEENIVELNIEKLLEKREQFQNVIDDIQAGLTVVNQEILLRLKEQKVSGMVVGNRAVSKVIKVIFATTLEQARELGAVKMEEKVDTTKLKNLYDAGAKVEGAKTIEYIMVKDLKTDAENESA